MMISTKMDEDYDSLYSIFDIPGGDDAYALGMGKMIRLHSLLVQKVLSIVLTMPVKLGKQEFSGADDYLYDLQFDGERLWAVGKYACDHEP